MKAWHVGGRLRQAETATSALASCFVECQSRTAHQALLGHLFAVVSRCCRQWMVCVLNRMCVVKPGDQNSSCSSVWIEKVWQRMKGFRDSDRIFWFPIVFETHRIRDLRRPAQSSWLAPRSAHAKTHSPSSGEHVVLHSSLADRSLHPQVF